jgi:hypothetical protein
VYPVSRHSRNVATHLDQAELMKFASFGNLVTNDWKADRNGEGYSQGLGEAGRSDLLGFARSVLAPRVQAAFEDFSERYGWGDPGQLSFSAKQPGGSDAAGGGLPRSPVGENSGPGQARGHSFVGTHFSTEQRQRLDGRYHGRGLRGAERDL